MEHFVSKTTVGESCGMCWRILGQRIDASHKVGEEIPHDAPRTFGHNATQYVCCVHFAMIVSPRTAVTWRGCGSHLAEDAEPLKPATPAAALGDATTKQAAGSTRRAS